MKKEDMKIYNAELGIDGTIPELVDWAYRYDADYSNEALDFIAEKAREFGFPEDVARIPELVKEDRLRESKRDESLPYEAMKLDKLRGGKISFSETKDYGEVEIYEEQDKVLLCISGIDDEGSFSAANAYSIEEFMEGETGFLEKAVEETLFYGKQYDYD